jgi:LDH2 family malate/lactate/ureidoglycolate dehydrogenase
MTDTPADAVRVPHEDLAAFVAAAAEAAGAPTSQATLLGTVLAENDLRGVFSHGTRQIASYSGRGYARQFRDGDVNPAPDVDVVRETPVSVVVDGDGGLGLFAAREATERALEKVADTGIAVLTTRNHGHVGAAGTYARTAVERGALSVVTSGVQLDLSPGGDIYDAAGASPMAFGAPAAEEHPLVLDFGTMHDLYPHSPHRDAIATLAPRLVLRHVGLGAVCQSFGGLLTGLSVDPPAERAYPGANQGAFAVFVRPDVVADPDRFAEEIDEYVRQTRALDPLDGYEEAMLPGGPEARNESEYRERGVPVGREHRAELAALAADLDVDLPFEAPA